MLEDDVQQNNQLLSQQIFGDLDDNFSVSTDNSSSTQINNGESSGNLLEDNDFDDSPHAQLEDELLSAHQKEEAMLSDKNLRKIRSRSSHNSKNGSLSPLHGDNDDNENSSYQSYSKKENYRSADQLSDDDDMYEENTSKKKKEKKIKPSASNKKEGIHKKIEIKVVNEINSVVQSEIEAVKRLETGYSEADMRRLRLIEIDPDELEERIEKINKISTEFIQKGRCTEEEQRLQLKSCQIWLHEQLKDANFEEIIEEMIEKNVQKLYGDEADPVVDAMKYIRQVDPTPEPALEPVVVEGDDILLSDSEDERDIPVPTSATTRMKSTLEPIERLKNLRYLEPCQRTRSKREELFVNLRKKIHEKKTENYCNQIKIQSDQFIIRLEIHEKCRQLVELLKSLEEFRNEKERESRRMRYLTMANDEEEEFDENDEEMNRFTAGQFVTEEEKLKYLEEFRRDHEEIDEEIIDEVEVLEEVEQEGEREGEAVEAVAVAIEERGAVVDAIAVAEVCPLEVKDTATIETMRTYSHILKRSTLQDVGDSLIFETSATLLDEAVSMEVSEDNADCDVSGEKREDNDDETDNVVLASESETVAMKGQKWVEKRKTGNMLYRLQLEEEERRLRYERKTTSNGLLDIEAEEEEAEGHQAGLGDFGFGATATIRENDAERDALRYRKGDLDHIVDDVSEGEGDEEEGLRARMDMELKEDKERIKEVITAVTEGYDVAARNKYKKNKKYSFEKLLEDRVKKGGVGEVGEGGEGQGGEEEGEVELDEEEMLQRGLKGLAERHRVGRQRRTGDSDGDSSDSAPDDVEDLMFDTTDMTEEQVKVEEDRLKRQKEKERMESLQRKQFQERTKIRRELRRRLGSSESSTLGLESMTEGGDPTDGTIGLIPNLMKRRTSLVPKRMSSFQNGSNRLLSSIAKRPHSLSGHVLGLDRHDGPSASIKTMGGSLKKSSSLPSSTVDPMMMMDNNTGDNNMYKSVLNPWEVTAGYGMGMASTASLSTKLQRTSSISNHPRNNSTGNGLFSTVTGGGLKRSLTTVGSSSNNSNNPLKRTFTSSAKRNRVNWKESQSNSSGSGFVSFHGSSSSHAIGTAIASQQYIFSSVPMNSSEQSFQGEFHSQHGFTNSESFGQFSHSNKGSNSNKENHNNNNANARCEEANSLFAKLSACSGVTKKSFSLPISN